MIDPDTNLTVLLTSNYDFKFDFAVMRTDTDRLQIRDVTIQKQLLATETMKNSNKVR